jgi:hypothetical protein
MSNPYGKVIYLEFSSIVGSDASHYIDGWHSKATTDAGIIEHAKRIRKFYPAITLTGYTRKGDHGHICEFSDFVLHSVNMSQI